MTIGTGFIMAEVYKGELWKCILIGFITVFLGAWIGSLVCFFIGRYIFRQLTARMAAKFRVM